MPQSGRQCGSGECRGRSPRVDPLDGAATGRARVAASPTRRPPMKGRPPVSRAFEPVTLGCWTLPQAFVMAPLTRNRAGSGMVPSDLRPPTTPSAPGPA